jgi:hypothetical protein
MGLYNILKNRFKKNIEDMMVLLQEQVDYLKVDIPIGKINYMKTQIIKKMLIF